MSGVNKFKLTFLHSLLTASAQMTKSLIIFEKNKLKLCQRVVNRELLSQQIFDEKLFHQNKFYLVSSAEYDYIIFRVGITSLKVLVPSFRHYDLYIFGKFPRILKDMQKPYYLLCYK